jgi:protein-S-isoprenylcysteine O-methyltransferase Ste14
MSRPRFLARAFAWAGGGLFVLALAVSAWFYVVQLGAAPAGAPPVTVGSIAFNLALFVVFAAHHSVLARGRVKAWLVRRVPAYLERPLYVWVASLLFLWMCVAWRPVSGEAWRLASPWTWLGYAVQAVGLVFTAIGARNLSPLELAGITQVQPAHASSRPIETSITTAGLYGWVRHPIYLGWLLMVGAAPVMTWGRLVFALISVAYLVVAIPWEERSLVEEFGASYQAYQARVRWRILPGVY